MGNQGGKALKWLPAHFNFERKIRLLFRECVHKFGTFCPEVRRGTRDGAFIYALSAGETSPVLAAPRHAITALLSCCFKCPCPSGWQPHFRSNADRAYNTLHFASKVVCQRDTLWKPCFVGVCSHTSSKMQNKRLQSAVKTTAGLTAYFVVPPRQFPLSAPRAYSIINYAQYGLK